jgi:hypothetical protein
MNRKGYERKPSWLNLRYYPNIGLESLRTVTKILAQPPPGPHMKPGPLQGQIRYSKSSAATFPDTALFCKWAVVLLPYTPYRFAALDFEVSRVICLQENTTCKTAVWTFTTTGAPEIALETSHPSERFRMTSTSSDREYESPWLLILIHFYEKFAWILEIILRINLLQTWQKLSL